MKKLTYLSILLFTFQSFATKRNFANRGGFIGHDEHKKSKKSWTSLAKTERESIAELVKIIETSKLGLKLVARARLKARESDKGLLDVVKGGEVSITDTTLIRRFSKSNPYLVEYDSESQVLVDRSHDVKNAVLDLVHELTHYVFKKTFNPYKKGFNAISFMKDTIEGKGGEVDAFVVECKVGENLFGRHSISPQCERIREAGGEYSRLLAKKEFYKLGNYFSSFMELVDEQDIHVGHLHHISEQNAQLISSAWGVPYPVAVIEEYNTIMGKVCHNDRKRMGYFEQNKARLPASDQISYKKVKAMVDTRCKKF